MILTSTITFDLQNICCV